MFAARLNLSRVPLVRGAGDSFFIILILILILIDRREDDYD
jgi:hypothetical protein